MKKDIITTIATFGHTVFHEDGKAAFCIENESTIDLDDDDQVYAYINKLDEFKKAMDDRGYEIVSITNEEDDDVYHTTMPWEELVKLMQEYTERQKKVTLP